MKKLLCLLILIILSGCGSNKPAPPPKTVAVSGKITLASGTPVVGGRVIFKPKQVGMQEAIGDINPDGSYTLSTYNKGDGAIPGDYIVIIETMSYKTGTPVVLRLNVPTKYQNERTSDITVSIVETGDYPIKLK